MALTFRFSVALSFPGEKRDYVSQVAQQLAEILDREKVLYDQFHEAEFARPDADIYLQRLYRQESALVVVFLCAEYERKTWPGTEWRAIRDLLNAKQSASVMLIRFDMAEVSGVFSGDICIDATHRTPTEIARRILERLRQVEKELDVEDLLPNPAPGRYPSLRPSTKPLHHRVTANSILWYIPAPTNPFYGRGHELRQLLRAVKSGCRLITILGMGGLGKTSVAVQVAKRLRSSFDSIFWADLRNGPRPEDILRNCAETITANEVAPSSPNRLIEVILEQATQSRCLIVLDNAESVLSTGPRSGEYRRGYDGYRVWMETFAKAAHSSCLIFTSREPPRHLQELQSLGPHCHLLVLSGLTRSQGCRFLRRQGIKGNAAQLSDIVSLYRGNPLALRLVAATIIDIFAGKADKFLDEKIVVFGEMRDLLESQFSRLSLSARAILYSLAIQREAVSPIALRPMLERTPSLNPEGRAYLSWQQILDAIQQLYRRSMVEKADDDFVLQPVIMEFLTDKIINQAVYEISTGAVDLLVTHPLSQATAKDYVRQSQGRMILQPLIEEIVATSGNDGLVNQLYKLLAKARREPQLAQSYLPGNLLNLLLEANDSVMGLDFSGMQIRQAYLNGKQLVDVSMASCEFIDSVFNDAFGVVYAVGYSTSGRLIAGATDDGEIRVWDSANTRLLRLWGANQGRIRTLAFGPNGHLLVTGGRNGTIQVQDADTGRGVHVFEECHALPVTSVCFDPTGSWIASASEDRSIRIWDSRTGRQLSQMLGHTRGVRALSWIFDNLVSAGADGTIRVWDVAAAREVNRFGIPDTEFWCIALSPDTELVASGGPDGLIRLWAMKTGKCLKVLKGHQNWVLSLAMHPAGKLIASGSSDQTIRLWDIDTGQCVSILRAHTNLIWSVAFSPAGTQLVSGGEDQRIRLWDIPGGQLTATLQGYSNPIRSVCCSKDGAFVVTAHGDHQIRVWDLQTGKCLQSLRGHKGVVRSVALSPDGKTLASASEDGTVRLWAVDNWECRAVLADHSNWVLAVAFHPHTGFLASASSDQTIRIWNADTGSSIAVIEEDTPLIRCLGFSADGRTLAVGTGGRTTIRLWDFMTHHCLKRLEAHSGWVVSLAFDPRGRLFATASNDGSLWIWNAATWECLHRFNGSANIVAFSDDGALIAIGSDTNEVIIRDTQEWQLVKTCLGHTDDVKAAAFVMGNRVLITGGDDESAIVWDVATGDRRHILRCALPYERLNIHNAKGLTDAQELALRKLGAR